MCCARPANGPRMAMTRALPTEAAVRPRWRSALAAALTIPLGLLTRADLPLPAIIAAYGGDTLYATLIFFLAALLWPRAPTWKLATAALGFCYAIELSQLYHAPWLDALRRTLPGRLVLGSGFRWDDLLCYAAGVLLAAAVDRLWLRAGDGSRNRKEGAEMDSLCPECGAPLPADGTCMEQFHALLALEGGFPGVAGSILHFYAVATYNLQHPDSVGLTAETLQGLRRNLADALDGKAAIEELRRRARRDTNGSTRVRRRPGDPPVEWHRGQWPITVVDMLGATAETYPQLVEDWARAVRATLDAADKAQRR